MTDSSFGSDSATLVLASASPRRRELIGALGLPFVLESADVDETLIEGEAPEAAALRLARAKSEAVAAQHPNAVVLGADTIVVLDGRILGKPVDAEEARAMLGALRDREHIVVTGVALANSRSGRVVSDAVQTRVLMRNYTDDEIEHSIAAGTPFDKAGAYAIQDEELAPVASIAGCYCNVVGLPLWTVRHQMQELRPEIFALPPSEARPACADCPLG
jgi:septum formation protein